MSKTQKKSPKPIKVYYIDSPALEKAGIDGYYVFDIGYAILQFDESRFPIVWESMNDVREWLGTSKNNPVIVRVL